MPTLLRYNRMTEAQRPPVAHLLRLTLRQHDGMPPAEIGWRLCVWFVNSRDRPCGNRDCVFLTERTPLEVLLTTEPHDPTGERLLALAKRALARDVLDAKAPLLVLCDWLEEHGMPEAALLRRFLALPQRWDRYCLVRVPDGATGGGVQ